MSADNTISNGTRSNEEDTFDDTATGNKLDGMIKNVIVGDQNGVSKINEKNDDEKQSKFSRKRPFVIKNKNNDNNDNDDDDEVYQEEGAIAIYPTPKGYEKKECEYPLIEACQGNQYEVVKSLLENEGNNKDIDINAKRKDDGATALFVSCREGSIKCVEILLSFDNIKINEPKINGRTPLFIASFFGYIEIIKLIITYSRNSINLTDSKGFTPLFVAAQNGYSEIVKLLIDYNANQNLVNQNGQSPLWISSLRGHIETVKVLLSNPNTNANYQDITGVSPLWVASQNNNTEVVQLLLENEGTDPNLSKSDGCSPIWIAASRGWTKCIELLIKYGANINKSDKKQGSGATPLFVACQNGKDEAVDILLSEKQTDINKERSGDGTTPIMIAAHNGNGAIIDKLLKTNDIDVFKTNKTGLNVFGCAAMEGHVGIIKSIYQYLLANYDNDQVINFVNDEDKVNGWTSFHLSCMSGHKDVIQYLIDIVKVDIDKKDYENKDGLEHAWQNGHESIVSMLSQIQTK